MAQVPLIGAPTHAARVLDKRCSVFRNAFRLWQAFLRQHIPFLSVLPQDFLRSLIPSLNTVGLRTKPSVHYCR
jgi:hypothetical protein